MTFQFTLVLALTLLCVLYFLKDILRAAPGGGCGQGCAGCKSGCPVDRLDAVQRELDKSRQNPA